MLAIHRDRWKSNQKIAAGSPDKFGFLKAWYLSRLRRKAPALTPSAILLQTRIADRLLKLPVRLNTDDAVVINGVFADREYDTELIKGPIKRVLDLGTNCGFALAYMSARFPEAKFACVEPDPRNLQQLGETIALNQLPATVFAAGIGPKTGKAGIKIEADRPSCNQITNDGEGNLVINVLSIDEVLQHMGWEDVDLIKMDIEGMEHDMVLQSGEAFKKARYVMFELHGWIDTKAVLDKLKELGFEVTQINKDGEQVYLAINQAKA